MNKFITKLEEALEAPDLPEKDEWTGARINAMYFLSDIMNKADTLHHLIDNKNTTKFGAYKLVAYYQRIINLYPDWDAMIGEFYGEGHLATTAEKPGIEYLKDIQDRLNSASERVENELS